MIFGLSYQGNNIGWKVIHVKQDAVEGICIEEEASNRRLKEAAHR
jgi:hypothetical protein